MAATQVLDLLRRGEEFHRVLADYYRRLAQSARRDDARLGLLFLSENECRLKDALHAYEADAEHGISGTWIKAAPVVDLAHAMQSVEVTDDLSLDDVAGMAASFDACLVNMFRSLAEAAPTEALHDAFAALAALESAGQHRALSGLHAV